jgi:hypothetical protein
MRVVIGFAIIAPVSLAIGILRGEAGWYIVAFATGSMAIFGFLARATRSNISDEWLRLHAIDFLECLKCRAPLDGLAESGQCPECQTQYDRELLRVSWRSAYPPPAMLANIDRAIEKRGLIPGRGPNRTKSLPSEGRLIIVVLLIWLSLTVLCFALDAPKPVTGLVVGYAGGLPIVLAIWWRSRGRARIIALDFRVCPRCNFDLRGLPSPGACPECHRRFSDRSLRVHWLLALKIPAKTSLGLTKERWLDKHPEDRAVSTPQDT